MSIRLYLMRHATALPHGTPSFREEDRPLTEEGRQEARAAAEGLKRLKIRPDAAFTSPYLRARQTAEEVLPLLCPGVLLKEIPSLRSEANPRETSQALKGLNGKHLIFFGHEPHLSRWAAELVDPDAQAQLLMKKAGVACVETRQLPPSVGGGILRWLATPKQLALIGKAK